MTASVRRADAPPTLKEVLRELVLPVTVWKVVTALILLVGAAAAAQRFFLGLGRTTHLTDLFPWGFWIGFDFLGIGLAAAGFTIVAAVHVGNIHRFEPIVKPAVLTAFVGYLLVAAVLVVDLGRFDRFYHPLILWNVHSVMFEITWCLTLYSCVLAIEFAPVALARFGFKAPIRFLRAVSLPFVVAGVILSTLHQSSFGSLYLVVPGRLHALWYSPILPFLFFLSCIAAGVSMIVLESLWLSRYGRHSLTLDLLSDLGKVVAVVLALYGTVRVQDLMERGALERAFALDYPSILFLGEFLLGVVLPAALLLARPVRESRTGLLCASVLAVMGFAANRMNTVVTGMESYPRLVYFPSWQEISISFAIAAAGFVAFRVFSRYFDVLHAPEAEFRSAAPRPLPPPTVSLGPRARGLRATGVVFGAVFVVSLALLGHFYLGARRAGPSAPAEEKPADLAPALASLRTPPDIVFRAAGGPGAVTFRHLSHVDNGAPNCRSCHGERAFRLLPAAAGPGRGSALGETAHDQRHCGSCHGKEIRENCSHCHAQ
ncbi:MAG: NrfD/PsrC family molybdoenzyme membrane anchor subunit [Candidatus Polarisedimenticolia bacterium]|nr:polysulfide reductase NrfD [bacterium]